MNSHTYGDTAAVFELGSKFNHSCGADENVLYRWQRPLGTSSLQAAEKGVFVATRDVEAGDELLVNYTGMLMSTPQRRSWLQETKFFRCECRLCSGSVDMLRALPCPACGSRRGSDGSLEASEDDDSANKGYILCNMALVTAGMCLGA